MKAKFDKLTYWNHDTPPSKDDPFLRSFHWFAVAEAVSFSFICYLMGIEISYALILFILALILAATFVALSYRPRTKTKLWI